MDAAELNEVMRAHDLLEDALMFYAYRDYARDFEIIVYRPAATDLVGTYSYLFRHCVEVCQRSVVSPETWKRSLDDRLTSFATYNALADQGVRLDGFVWGVGSNQAYWQRVADSERAARWSVAIGIPFHEVVIDSDALQITLVFAELVVEKLSSDEDGAPAEQWLPRFIRVANEA